MSPLCIEKPHVVLVPYPAQGHINPMLRLAKLLHCRGFHVTFVNTEYNHKRLLKVRGPNALHGLPDFCFETIPDGLPPTDADDATQDIPSLSFSVRDTCVEPFLHLIAKLNDSASPGGVPKVSCIVSDGVLSFGFKAARKLGLPVISFSTICAGTFMSISQFSHLIDTGVIPFKDESYLRNEYLEQKVEWIPCMKDVRLMDLPSFIRTTDRNDMNFKMMNFLIEAMENATKADAILLNTFSELEPDIVTALSSMFPSLYTIGPVHLLADHQVPNKKLESIGSNLWKEEAECMQWLDGKESYSVVYVNYGSITFLTPEQLTEFAWGLANSKKPFFWIIRPDLVNGGSVILSSEFVNETKDRGLIAGWCSQEQVLRHPSIGCFLTHCGWNSTIESISQGVPLACWPFFADQQTNCRFSCNEWGVGMEIDSNVKRHEVEKLLKELMEGEKGKAVKANAMKWKKKAEEAVRPDGSSSLNLDKLIENLLLKTKHTYP